MKAHSGLYVKNNYVISDSSACQQKNCQSTSVPFCQDWCAALSSAALTDDSIWTNTGLCVWYLLFYTLVCHFDRTLLTISPLLLASVLRALRLSQELG